MDKKRFRIDEIADAWKVSRKTVEREIHRGNLEAFHIGKTIRVKQEALEEYERKKKLD